MRLVSLVFLVACGASKDSATTTAGTPSGTPSGTTGGTPSGSTTTAPTVCAVEATLATEQAALGLTVPSVCADLVEIGDQTLLQAGLVPAGTDFGAVLSGDALDHRAEFEGTRLLYRYDDVAISVPSRAQADVELLILTAQALAIWRADFPGSAAILDEMREHPTEPTLGCCDWRNRYTEVVLSLDATPRDIGASVAVLGQATGGAVQTFDNTALLSIDRETVLGSDADVGSKAIYVATDARENLLRYFADGAVFTLAHEATHLYIDQRNSVSQVANWVWNGRNYVNDAYRNAEEVLANYSACEPLAAGLSAEMLAADVAVTANLRSLYGVDARLEELRAMSNAASPRLLLDASAGCGGG